MGAVDATTLVPIERINKRTSYPGHQSNLQLLTTFCVSELKAAKEAGLTAVLIKREGNPEVTDDSFPAISSFSELFSPSSKRKNEDDEVDASAEVCGRRKSLKS